MAQSQPEPLTVKAARFEGKRGNGQPSEVKWERE